MRWLAIVPAALTALVLLAPAHANRAVASAYSTADSPGTQGCTGRPLREDTLTFASLIVPCGARVQFCVGHQCVVATRTDSGPYVAGRSFDLALGTVRALGFTSARQFGVREVSWRVV